MADDISISQQRELLRQQQAQRRALEQERERLAAEERVAPPTKPKATGIPSSPISRSPAPQRPAARPSGAAVPIKPPMGAQFSPQPATIESERDRDRSAKPGGGETRQEMLSDAGGPGVLPTIPATYGAVSDEEKGIREKEGEMKRTQEQLLGPQEKAAPTPTAEEEAQKKERPSAPRAMPAPTLAARQAAAEQAEEEAAVAGSVAGQQPPLPPAIKAAQLALRSQKMIWLLSFYGIPVYAAVGTFQLLHKIFGSPLGKQFDSKFLEDALAVFLDICIALILFGIVYFFIAIIAAFSV